MRYNPDLPGVIEPVKKYTAADPPMGEWSTPEYGQTVYSTPGEPADTKVMPYTTGWFPIGDSDMNGRIASAPPVMLPMSGPVTGGEGSVLDALAQAYGATAYRTPTSAELIPAFISQ